MSNRKVMVAAGLLISLPFATMAFAGDDKPSQDNPSQVQMKDALTPVPPALARGVSGLPIPGTPPARPVTKALTPASTGNPQTPTAAPAEKPSPKPPALAGCPAEADTAAKPALSLQGLTFRFGSARLEPDAIPLVQTLAKTMTDDLPNATFTIEGHTDATGGFAYNQALSLSRAEAVKAYLLQSGIKPERLETKGVGYCGLANPQDPAGAENRRVVIVNTAG